MYQKTKRDYTLEKIVRRFKEEVHRGRFEYWEGEELVTVIRHFETELEFNNALRATKLGIERFPYQVEFYLSQTRILLYTSKSDQALDVLEKAENVAPSLPEIRLLRSEIFSALGYYDRSLQIISSLKDELIGYDRLELFIRESYIYESMKDFDSMFYSLKQALETDPDNNEALEQMWMSVELSKRYVESVDLHTILVDKNPYSHLAWYNLGHAYSCLGEYNKAIEALEYSFIIRDDYEAGYMDCAELCFQVKNYKKAFVIYEEANEHFGPDAELLVYMVECLIPLKKYNKAKKYLLRALTIDPYNDEVHFYLGECHSAVGEWKEAVKAYNKAIKIEDRREEYYGSLALAYEKCDNLKMAEYYYTKATSVGPEQNQSWINHARFAYENQDASTAYEILKKADLFAVGADLQFCRAACLFALDRKNEATDELAEALQDDISWTGDFLNLYPDLKNNDHVMSMIRYYEGELNPKI